MKSMFKMIIAFTLSQTIVGVAAPFLASFLGDMGFDLWGWLESTSAAPISAIETVSCPLQSGEDPEDVVAALPPQIKLHSVRIVETSPEEPDIVEIDVAAGKGEWARQSISYGPADGVTVGPLIQL